MKNIVNSISTPVSQNLPDLDEVVDSFLKNQRSNNTKIAYANDLQQFFRFSGIQVMSDLAIPFHSMVDNVHEFLEYVTKRDAANNNRILNPTTVNRKAFCLSSFFKELIFKYGYLKNPVASFKPPKTPKFSRTSSLSKLEVLDLLRYAKKESTKTLSKKRNYIAILMMLILALRRSELINIRISDINFAEKKILVFAKGGEYRELDIPEGLIKEIQQYLYERDKAYLDSEFLFNTLRNNRKGNKSNVNKIICAQYIYTMIKTYSKKIGLDKNITPHSLRRTFTEISLENGEDYISIMNITGWKNMDMCRYYDNPSRKSNAPQKIADEFL